MRARAIILKMNLRVKYDELQNTGKFNSLGQEIVTFNNRELSPTVKAKSWQGDGLYPGVD